MGSRGNCYDNAMAESFFATLECELIKHKSWSGLADAQRDMFEYIEGWYNTRRRHSSLGFLSPIDFERSHAQAPLMTA